MEKGWRAKVSSIFHPHLLSLKALFFFSLAACASVIPYISIYNRYLGLSASQNGLLFGGLPFIAMLSKPLTGALADKSSFRPATLSRIFMVIQTIFLFSVYLIPRADPDNGLPSQVTCSFTSCQATFNQITADIPSGNFSCNVTWSDINDTIEYVNVSNLEQLGEFVSANGKNASCCCDRSPMTAGESDQSGLHWTTQFWLMGLLLVLGFYGAGAATTINDTIAFSLVETSPTPTTYGSNRVFGSIGWALGALLVGVLLNTFSEDTSLNDNHFTSMFVTFLVVGCFAIGSTFFLPPIKNLRTVRKEVSVGAQRMLSFDVVLFGGGIFMMGICSGLLNGYFGWYLTELGASNLLIGVAVFSQCVFEGIMMAFSGRVIRKVGYHNCMVVCLMSLGIRFLGYYFLVDPWYVLFIETLHSTGFGLFYAAMTSFAFERAPPGGGATLQGIFGAAYEGFGQAIGGVAAGFIYQYYGGRTTWLAYGLFALAIAGCYAALEFFGLRRTRPLTDETGIPL